MARFMAVANARPFVQATDGSYSFMLDHNGQWLAKSGQKDLQLLQHNVVTNTRRTVYSLLGEWVVVASIVVVVCQLVYVYKKS
jgi:apolipoprotein N-acyltransferase